MRTSLPGSVVALILTAVLLTALSMTSPPTEGSSPILEIGPLQPVGGDADEAANQLPRAQVTRRHPVAAPKPLVIREPSGDAQSSSEMAGQVAPTSARCRVQIGGCLLELDFQNRTNGFVTNVDISFELSRSGGSIRKGYLVGNSDRLAPKDVATVVERINDLVLGSYELTHCVEVFDWFSDEGDTSADTHHPDRCASQRVVVGT